MCIITFTLRWNNDVGVNERGHFLRNLICRLVVYLEGRFISVIRVIYARIPMRPKIKAIMLVVLSIIFFTEALFFSQRESIANVKYNSISSVRYSSYFVNANERNQKYCHKLIFFSDETF